MRKPSSKRSRNPETSVPRLTQPETMKAGKGVYGVEMLNGNEVWALFEASALGNKSKVKTLLAKDRRLANAQIGYRLPIHLAVYAGHSEIVQLLLDQGADPGQSVYTYNSWDKLLACAAERGDRRIESLLRRAMHKRFRYTPDFEPLKAAIVARNPRKVGVVLRRNQDLARASDALGNNPLHWSVITRQLGLIDYFVQHGTPIDARRADGQTPVLLAVNGATDYWYRDTRGRSHPSLRNASVLVGSLLAHGAAYTISVAAAVGDQERVEQLLADDPTLARQLDSARASPLTYAAQEGHLHIVRLLLEHGADPNMPEDGAPLGGALFAACARNHIPIAQLLLEQGANPNAGTDSNGCCLTIGKVYHGDAALPMEELLRQHGAITPPYAMNPDELKQAIRDNHEVLRHEEFSDNVVRTGDPALIEFYEDSSPAARNQLGLSSVVACPQAPSLVKMLLARGMDPNQTDWLGRSPLHAAAEAGDRSVAELLLDAGAEINAREVEFQGTPLAAAVRVAAPCGDSTQEEWQKQMVEFLLQRGAKANLPDDPPWATPLAWATRHGRADLVALLDGAM
jgi:ankyrin repeat protein